jgi:two-component system, OmpR family, sensor kinase
VGLLALGLAAAGFGTMAFLRFTLVGSVESSLAQLANGEIALSVFDTTNDGGYVEFDPRLDVADTGTIVVVYGANGEIRGVYDGTDHRAMPTYPGEWTLQDTYTKGGDTLTFGDQAKTGAQFLARVGVLPIAGVSENFTQMVIQPLAPAERIIAAYTAIYSIVALLILVTSALLTRWLVTLTFRSLGQVESTAMSIAAGDFSQRMGEIEPGTEVGRLKSAINTMLDRIDRAIGQREATVRQMRRFIGDASHELRTPLVTVRGYAELFRMGAIRGDEDVAQAMDRIEKEAIRMGVLVEDLLALARLDERRDVAFAPVDLRPIARDAALDLRAASPGRVVSVEDTTASEGLRVTGDLLVLDAPAEKEESRRRPSSATAAISLAGATFSRLRRRPRGDDEPDIEGPLTPTGTLPTFVPLAPIVRGDENRIRQVVANLLGNARRFTPDDSPVELRVGVDPTTDRGWIEVVDHGEGIPEQIREQIFQRFWRADTSRARETGGSGLGLSIVASIVEALHGSVTVTGTPGGGATFRVSLPLAPAGAEEAEEDD